MRRLVIFDRAADPKVIGDHPWVLASTVTPPGVLVIDLAVTPGTLATRIAYAPGYWGRVLEHDADDLPEATSPAAETIVSAPVPVLPGLPDATPQEQAEVDELRAGWGGTPWAGPARPEDLSDADRVKVAMLIRCTCAQLRCPVELNPATHEERSFWQRRQWTGFVSAGPRREPEPRQQCSYLIGHDIAENDHEWIEGGWPYGPSKHHPMCPRNPENYNRPGSVVLGEGQTPLASGITPAPQLSDWADVPATHPLTDRPPADPPLARPYIDPPAPYDPNALLEGPDNEVYLRDVRKLWKVCAVPGPDDPRHPFPVWCNQHQRHIEPDHAMDRPGGERIVWARRGATVQH